MIKVLHVVENFNGQAVESWLTRAVCHESFDRKRLRFDFFLLGMGFGKRSDVLLNRGCILHSGNQGCASIPEMSRALRRVVKNGKYDVVHVHQDVMAGIFALALLGTGVKIITHLHNCQQRLPVGGYWKEKFLTWIAKHLVLWLSNAVIGVSSVPLSKLTKGRNRPGRIDRVIYCGVDSSRFLKAASNRLDFRDSLGLPRNSLVLIFAGRLVPEKNPVWALEVLLELRKLEPHAVCVFVGQGNEAHGLELRALQLGLEGVTRFLGWRDDLPEIMCCCDWFIHAGPESPMEGFGLVALEAQLAGLRLLLSKGVPVDALLPGSCTSRLSVNQSAAIWAREAQYLLKQIPPTRKQAAEALAHTPMEQTKAFNELLGLY